MRKPLEREPCKDIEYVNHLFFECVVARLLWEEVFHVLPYYHHETGWQSNRRTDM
jgi:hypothetical protein